MSEQLKPDWHKDPDVSAVSHVHHACLMGAKFLQPETASFKQMTPEIRQRLSTLINQWSEATNGLAELQSELLEKQRAT